MADTGLGEKLLIFGKTKAFYKIEAMIHLDKLKAEKVIPFRVLLSA